MHSSRLNADPAHGSIHRRRQQSGEIGIIKPDRRIFEHAIERCRLDPARSVFIDDMPANVEAAQGCGLHVIHFTSPESLRATLGTLGVLSDSEH